MNRLLSLSILLLFIRSAIAQPDEYRLAAIPQGASLFGYANLKGEMVIEPQFVQAFGFDPNGVSLGFLKNEVSHSGGQKETVKPFVFFDANGNPLKERQSRLYMVRQKFNYAREMRGFYDGIFIASTNERITDRYGMNYEGKAVTKTDYTWMSFFSEGFAVAKHRKNGFVIVKPEQEDAAISIEVVEAKDPTEGLAAVKAKNGLWGFINKEGEVAIPAKFKDVGNFWGGYCWARNENDLIGYIDAEGEWVIQPKFTKAKYLDPVSGIAMVVEKRDWCYVNLDGKVTYGEKKQKLYEYSEGLAIKRDPNTKKVGCVDANGDWVIEPTFEVIRPFLHGFAVAKQDKFFGLLDKKGNWVIEPKFVQLMDAYPIDPK
ncbi:MAG: WG repeat-containing protein [Flavobacteriales bacterium]|nr:WG repeat-containing protein [Flavobacteriales bacterium]